MNDEIKSSLQLSIILSIILTLFYFYVKIPLILHLRMLSTEISSSDAIAPTYRIATPGVLDGIIIFLVVFILTFVVSFVTQKFVR